MHTQHRYILEPYNGIKSRHHCPYCQHKDRRFSRYINTVTGEYLADHVGRCERVDSCGVHYKPKQYFEDNGKPEGINSRPVTLPIKQPVLRQKPVSFVPAEVLLKSLKSYDQNHFVSFLISRFGKKIAGELIKRYLIGTSQRWAGATIFWQVDQKGRIRTGKIMLYNPETGKRVKVPNNHFDWVHKNLKLADFSLDQCLFGEHLLKDRAKPVAVVESEKTAIIASVYFPEFIWLAVGGIANLSQKRCKVLQGRRVVLFPDLNGFEKWSEKAKELTGMASLTVSDLLEQKATEAEKKLGLDLADYLIKFNPSSFVEGKNSDPKKQAEPSEPNTIPPLENQAFEDNQTEADLPPTTPELATTPSELVNWDNEIVALELFFQEFPIPQEPIQLNQCSRITNANAFIKSGLTTAKTYRGSRAGLPYLERMKQLKELMSTIIVN